MVPTARTQTSRGLELTDKCFFQIHLGARVLPLAEVWNGITYFRAGGGLELTDKKDCQIHLGARVLPLPVWLRCGMESLTDAQQN